jgi:predicted O-methyltransferase YrrM
LVFFGVIIFSAVSLAFSLHATSCASDAHPTIDGILDKYIKALGGKKAIEKIRTRRLRGELTHDFPGQNPPKTVLPAEVLAAAPDKWRLILKTASGVQQMGFDGRRGWRQDSDRVLIDDQHERSRLAYLFHPQAAIRLGDYFSGLSLPEKVVTEGRAEYAIKATDAGGTQRTLYFDIESGLLSRLGENILVKGYHRELGVLHPDHIVIAREGGTSTYVFNDIAANIAIEDARFAIPTLGEVFPDVFEGLEDPRIVPLLKDFPSVHEDMNIPCRDGRFLYDLIVRNGYKKGLEIGTFTGYSALWMGWAFKKNGGRLITIEVESGPGEKARQNIQSAGLESVVDARIADAFAEIPKIAGEFDFVFIDAWKPDYLKFLQFLRGRVAAGGVIVAHNVTNYARDMRDYLAAIQKDAGLETTFNEGSAEGMSISKVLGPNPVPGDSRLPDNAPGHPEVPLLTVEAMQHDFKQLRRTLESEHCCLYEYTGEQELNRIFDARFKLIDRPMRYEEFFRIIAPITAKIGCMHTALWMPDRFLNLGPENLFPLQVKLLENNLVVTGGYRDTPEVPVGSTILEINELPTNQIVNALRTITSADALNPYFIDSQVEKRFPMFYASVFGFPEKFTVTYALPGRKTRANADLHPADIGSVRKVIFANFRHPPLTIDFLEDQKTAIMTVRTFSYYDRVDYFKDFMDRSFQEIKEKGIENLVLDLRGNDGGDAFCAVILYSYLEKEPAPYFAGPYGKYAELAKPVPLAENHFGGQLYTLLDGRCGSTNGHFSALLKYHRLGKFVGTPSGSTYKCNAGKNMEIRLDRTSVILTLGRSTYAAAVKGMDKAQPIMPDYPVRETYQDFLDGKDVYLEAAMKLIGSSNRSLPQLKKAETWIDKPQKDWPQITMINQIEYVDKQFPIAACSFLLETGKGVFAVTAKHVLTFFKSASMTSVSFGDSLKNWVMFPKNNPADTVVIDALINENPDEPINQICPSSVDWLLFSIKSRSDNIQPLKFRSQPLEPQEKVYIVGWRYSDKDCPQVIYEANYIETQDGAVIISTKTLQDNRMPGLSGAPVIDSHGDLIGIMSQKYGQMEKLGSIDYPKRIIAEKYR